MSVNSALHQVDPLTGGCSRCGARREEMEDNLAPDCPVYIGPHAQALYALHREAYRIEAEERVEKNWLAKAENAIVVTQNRIREIATRREHIDAAMRALQEPQESRFGLSEAIGRLTKGELQ